MAIPTTVAQVAFPWGATRWSPASRSHSRGRLGTPFAKSLKRKKSCAYVKLRHLQC